MKYLRVKNPLETWTQFKNRMRAAGLSAKCGGGHQKKIPGSQNGIRFRPKISLDQIRK
jgi:hypothetical protein